MALTISEQLNIINGVVAPLSNTLEEIVLQVAVNAAQDINDDAKVFDGTLNPLAEAYLRKMLAAADKAISNNLPMASIVRLLVAIYSDTGSYATVELATDAQWVSFIENNITKTFELSAGVRNAEKTAYAALP